MNVVSFSLYGNNPMYTVGTIENAKLMPKIYPGWKMFVYHGIEVDHNVIMELNRLGCITKVMPHIYGTTPTPLVNTSPFGKFWRFQAIAEPGVNMAIFRDCDSRINIREFAAVLAWTLSDSILHTMKDHVNHSKFQILAGMWGIRGGRVDIMGALSKWEYTGEWFDDQIFLEHTIWPQIGHSSLNHGRYNWQGTPFPPHPPYTGFVGQRVNADGTLLWE